MRIAFIGQQNQNTEKVAQRLAEFGNEVFAFFASNDKNAKKVFMHKGIRLRHMPDFANDFLNDFFATILAVFGGHDVVHFQSHESGMFALVLKIFRPSVKVVTSFGKQNPDKKISEWLSAKFSDKVIVLNKKDKVVLRKKYEFHAMVVPSGNDEKYTEHTEAIHGWRLRSKKYFLTFGNVCPDSQIHELIEVFKHLEDTAKTPNNFKLVIAAESFENDAYENQLRSLAQGRENIVFLESSNEKVLSQLFSHAYLFIDPSIVGSTKKVILKAMKHDLAILVSDVRKNTAVVGSSGFKFETKSFQVLHDRLAFLISRAEEVEKMAAASKQYIENEFSWNAVTKKTLEAYETCGQENRTLRTELIGN